MSGWGCPHESNGACSRLSGRACDPGMRGCILHGRFRFANEDKNRKPKTEEELAAPRPQAGEGLG